MIIDSSVHRLFILLLMKRDLTLADHIFQNYAKLMVSIQALSPGLRLVACCCIWELEAFKDTKAALLLSICTEVVHLWSEEQLTARIYEELLFCLNVLISEDYEFYECSADFKDILKRFIDDVLTTAQEKLTTDKYNNIASIRKVRHQPDEVSDFISERESDKTEALKSQLQDIRGLAKRMRSLLEGTSDKVN